MQRLLHGLVDRFGREAQRGTDARGRRGAEMGDVIYLMLVQADALYEIDLHFVAGGQAFGECGAREATMLRHGEDWRDVVAGMRIIGGKECVVEVQLTHCNAVGPGRPFGRDTRGGGKPEHGGSRQEGVRLRLRAGADDRPARQ